MKTLLRKLRWRMQRRIREADLSAELQFHLDEEADERMSEGQAEQEARRAARLDLGNPVLLKEGVRAVWGWPLLEQLFQDVRYALRTMRRNRSFAALVVLSLALGTGANTTIYSFMDSLLLRPLGVPNPSSLALLNWHSRTPDGIRPNHVAHSVDGSTWRDDSAGLSGGIFPFGAFELLRTNPTFSTLFAYYPTEPRNLTIRDQAELAAGEYVSGDYFRGLAVTPAAGRLIQAEDDSTGAPLVVIISARVSQRRFSGPASAVGHTVRIDNLPFTVVGVTPESFAGVDPQINPEFYVPLHTNLVLDGNESWAKSLASYHDPNYYWVELMGRLAPGVTLAQAQAALSPVFHQWVATTASNGQERASLPALVVHEGARGSGSLRRQFSQPLYVLLAIASLILAIACANTGNLLLSRATARRREMAVRLSMGAGRLRLIRQFLTESLMLSLIGGAVGLVLALWGMRVLTVLLANGQENFTLRAELNWHVLAASFTVSTLCGAAFGLAPAIRSTGVDLVPALKQARLGDSGRDTRVGSWQRSLGPALVVAQIVISLVLLAVGGLFVRTLSNLQAIPIGFNPNNVLLFTLNARQAGHSDPEILAFYEELRTRFAAIPGVRGATLSHAPLLGAGRRLDVGVAGERAPDVWILNTGPRFFSTMQIPMRRGRQIDERDGPGSPGVVVVNEFFAKRYFGDADPVGRRVTLGGPHPRDMEIVGVASNAHYGRLKDDLRPVFFIPYNQGDYPRVQQMVYALRTSGDPRAIFSTVRDIVHRADSRIPVVNVMTATSEIERGMNQEIILAQLCTAFAFLALVIAAVGLYGTVAYTVERRTGEIGLRMALGAQRWVVMRMILRQVLVLVAVALAVGLPSAMGASRLVESFLFGVKATDPATLTFAATVLVVAALVAGYLPARRAARTDPLAALRQE
jgi:macrolide transport system ATP-binding/permease protein